MSYLNSVAHSIHQVFLVDIRASENKPLEISQTQHWVAKLQKLNINYY